MTCVSIRFEDNSNYIRTMFRFLIDCIMAEQCAYAIESSTLKLSGTSFISTCRNISSMALTMRPSLCCGALPPVFGGNSDDGDGNVEDGVVVDMPARRGFGPSIVCVLPDPLRRK